MIEPFAARVRPAAVSILVLALLAPALGPAQKDPTSRSWNQPVAPFRIVGNLYYVGASDVTSYLIATPVGHVLLDGGFEETAPLIEANIRKLGFRLEDVRLLLGSHAHYDHAGGLARLKEATGAKLLLSAADAELVGNGGKGDFRWGDEFPYPPAKADRIVADGDRIVLDGVSLIAHLTPGHTKGNTTWTTRIGDGGKVYDVVFAGSTSINPGVRLLGNPKYPKIADDYATAFRVLRGLPCDVFLAPHGSFFDLAGKAARLAKGESPNPFVDPAGYRAYLDASEEAYRRQLEAERKAGSAP